MFITRHIAQAVQVRAVMKGAIVITGARQVGKSTLLEQQYPHIPIITLDDIPTRQRASSEPSTFFDFNPPPVIVDEVQYAPEIFHYIKILLDKSKKKGEFFLTGSQSFQLMENVTESLAGRAAILDMHGLSLREINNETWNRPFLPTTEYLKARSQSKTILPIPRLWEIIHCGCLPELVANPHFPWQPFYADYVKTYIERDVRQLTQVADEGNFYTFMSVCAAMTGQLLNLASLARDVNISEPTAKRWLSILKTSGLIYLLKPYSNNAIKRAVKTPKLYFMDVGLAAYLARWLTPETLLTGAMNVHFFETFVVSEIIKSYANAGLEVDIYFLRDGHQNEIDLLIHENNTLYPLEIKTTAQPEPKDISKFSLLDKIKGVSIGEGGIICPVKTLLPLTAQHKIIPLWAV